MCVCTYELAEILFSWKNTKPEMKISINRFVKYTLDRVEDRTKWNAIEAHTQIELQKRQKGWKIWKRVKEMCGHNGKNSIFFFQSSQSEKNEASEYLKKQTVKNFPIW